MARGFVLTAALQLQAPRNVNSVIAGLQRRLNSINTNINIRINAASARNVATLNRSIATLNGTLSAFSVAASAATADMNNLSAAFRASGINLSAFNQSTQKTANSLNRTTQAANQAGDAVENFARAGVTAIKRYASFAAATSGVYALIGAMNSGIKEAVNFQHELVKISQVTGTSLKDLGGLEKEITRLSTTLGVSSAKLVNVSQILAQAGLSAREVKVGLEALAKTELAATFTDVERTVEGAIASMRQFNLGAEDLEKTLGSFNSVAGGFAVESDDIVTAVRRAGAAFSASGGSLNQFIALFTSVRQTTRESAETIATGFRTIFTRFQRPKTIEFLRQMGIELTDVEGKFVGPYEAIRRLSAGLKDLDTRDLKFAEVVEELGGFRQVSKVIPLIQQFSVAERALGVAIRGETSLTKDAAVAQQSFVVQLEKVRQEFYDLFRTIGNDSAIQSFGKLMLELARNAIQLTEALTPLIPALTTIGAVKIGGALLSAGRGFAKKNQGGKIHKFARGGLVPGQGNTDSVPAMLQPGEFVITKKAVQHIGAGNLHGVNKYADGGKVGVVSLDRKVGVINPITIRGEELLGISKAKTNPKTGKLRRNPSLPKSLRDFQETYQVETNALFDNPSEVDDMLGKIKMDTILKSGISAMSRGIADKIGGNPIKAVNVKTIPNRAGIIGGLFEGALSAIGGAYGPEKTDDQASFDFPGGLAASGFGEIPTDAKKSITSDTQKSIRKKIIALSKEKNRDKIARADLEISQEKMLQAQDNIQKGISKRVANKDLPGLLAFVRSSQAANQSVRFEASLAKKYGYSKLGELQADLSDNKEFDITGKKGSKYIGIKRAANGGLGSHTDTVPALLTPGEFVINKKSAQSIGYSNLGKMNKIHKYAKGGTVGQTSSTGSSFGNAAILGSIIGPSIINELEKAGGIFKGIGKDAASLTSQFILLTAVMDKTGISITKLSQNQQSAFTKLGASAGFATGGTFGAAKRGANIARGIGQGVHAAGSIGLVAGGTAMLIGNRFASQAGDALDEGDFSQREAFIKSRRLEGAGQGATTGFFAGSAGGALAGGVVGGVVGILGGPAGVAAGAKIGASIGTVAGPLIGTLVGGFIGDNADKAIKEADDKIRKFKINENVNNIASTFSDIKKGIVGFATGAGNIGSRLGTLNRQAIGGDKEAVGALRNSGYADLINMSIERFLKSDPKRLKELTGGTGDIFGNNKFAEAVRAEAIVTAADKGTNVQDEENKLREFYRKQAENAQKVNQSTEVLYQAMLRAAESFSKYEDSVNQFVNQRTNGGFRIDSAIASTNGSLGPSSQEKFFASLDTAINGSTLAIKQQQAGALRAGFTQNFGQSELAQQSGVILADQALARAAVPQIIKQLEAGTGPDRFDESNIRKAVSSAGFGSADTIDQVVVELSKILNQIGEDQEGQLNPYEAANTVASNISGVEAAKKFAESELAHTKKLQEIYAQRVTIEQRISEISLKKVGLEEQAFTSRKLFENPNYQQTTQQAERFRNARLQAINGGKAPDLNNAAQRIFDLRQQANAVGGAEGAKLNAAANDLAKALEFAATNTDVLTVKQNALIKAQEESATKKDFVKEFAFAGQEGRQDIMKQLQTAFLLSSGPSVIGNAEQEGNSLKIFERFKDLKIFSGGQSGQDVIDTRIKQAAFEIQRFQGVDEVTAKAMAEAFLKPSSKEQELQKAIQDEFTKLIGFTKEMSELEKKQTEYLATIAGEQQPAQNKARGGKIGYFAGGGNVFKPRGTDTVPAMLTPGEFVVTRNAAKNIGYGTLSAMNTMYAADGGVAGQLGGLYKQYDAIKSKISSSKDLQEKLSLTKQAIALKQQISQLRIQRDKEKGITDEQFNSRAKALHERGVIKTLPTAQSFGGTNAQRKAYIDRLYNLEAQNANKAVVAKRMHAESPFAPIRPDGSLGAVAGDAKPIARNILAEQRDSAVGARLATYAPSPIPAPFKFTSSLSNNTTTPANQNFFGGADDNMVQAGNTMRDSSQRNLDAARLYEKAASTMPSEITHKIADINVNVNGIAGEISKALATDMRKLAAAEALRVIIDFAKKNLDMEAPRL